MFELNPNFVTWKLCAFVQKLLKRANITNMVLMIQSAGTGIEKRRVSVGT